MKRNLPAFQQSKNSGSALFSRSPAENLFQHLQRAYEQFPAFFQLLKALRVFFRNLRLKAPWVHIPWGKPLFPRNRPQKSIIFQISDLCFCQRRKARFHKKRELFRPPAPADGLQSREYKTHQRFRFHRPGIVHENGNLPCSHGFLQHGGIFLRMTGDDGEIPIMVAFFHNQIPDGSGHKFRFVIHSHLCCALIRFPGRPVSAFLQRPESFTPKAHRGRKNHRRRHGNVVFSGRVFQADTRSLNKGKQPHTIFRILRAVCTESDMYICSLLHHQAQNAVFLHSKTGESIHQNEGIPKKAMHKDWLLHPGQILQRIHAAFRHQSIIRSQNQR